MKIRLGLFAGVLGAALLAGSAANATPTLLGTTTDPTGINNLNVDGTNYDVTFSLTTLNSFTAYSTLSFDADSALASALNALNVTDLNNATADQYYLDLDNNLNSFNEDVLDVFGPTWMSASTNTGGAWISLGYQGGAFVEAADFSVPSTAVPEPSSLPMLLAGLGLIGGAFHFGRKKVLARV